MISSGLGPFLFFLILLQGCSPSISVDFNRPPTLQLSNQILPEGATKPLNPNTVIVNKENNGTIDIVISCPSGISFIEIKSPSNLAGPYNCQEGVATVPVDSTPLDEGETNLVITAPENKAIDPVQIPIVKKTTDPSVAISPSVSEGFVNQSIQKNVTVKGQCSEIGKSVMVTAFASSSTVKKQTECSASQSFELTLNTELLPDGQIDITARHYDSAGNFAESAVTKDKDTINDETAILSFEPTGTSALTYFSSTVSGTDLSGYIYKIGPAATTNCSTLSGYGSEVSITQDINTDLTSFGEGALSLCVLTIDVAKNLQPTSNAKVVNWIRDTTVVNTIVSDYTPSGTLSNQAGTRTLEVSGEYLTEYKYEIINSGSCSDVDFSSRPTYSISTPISFDASTDNTYQICIIAKNEAGYWQTTPSAPPPFRLDLTSPTPVLAYTGAEPLNTSPMVFSAIFNEVVQNFTSSDLSIVNGTIQSFTGSGSSYSFSILPISQGSVSVSVNASSAQDLAGNSNNASNTINRNFDSVSPDVTISSPTNASTNQTSIPVTISFSEPVTGFIVSDLIISNGSVNSFSGSGSIYTLNLVPSSEGAVTLQVPSGVAVDAGGNLNTTSSFSRIYETVPPTVSLSTLAGVTFNSSPLNVTASFSEDVTGFTTSDLTLTNGTATISGSGSTYTILITPSGQGEVSVSVKSSSYSDIAGNINTTVSNSISSRYDSLPPTAVLSTLAGTNTKNSPLSVTATFSEEITGLSVQDLELVNATATITGSIDTYSITLTPTSEGAFSVRVKVNSVTDLSGLENSAASNTLSFNYDTTSPTVALSSAAPPYVNSSFSVTATFSESVSGFALSDLLLTNGTASGLSGSGSAYTFTITPTAQGTLSVSVPADIASDAADNNNLASTGLSRIYDNTAPTSPTISINSNAAYTIVTSVNLALSAVGSPTGMNISSTSGCTGGTWEPYATSRTWTLTSLNTTANVYVKFRDLAQNESACVSDSIIHDNTPPATVSSLADGSYKNSLTTSPTLSWPASSDAGSGINHYELAIGTSAGAQNIRAWKNMGTALSSIESGLTLVHGTRYYPSVRVFDNAGNISAVRSGDGWLVDTVGPNAPTGISLSASSVSVLTETPNLYFTAAADAHTGTASHQVRLLRTSDSAQVVGWTNFASGGKFTGLSLAYSTSYYFQVRGIDAAGNIGTIANSPSFSTPNQQLITWTITAGTSSKTYIIIEYNSGYNPNEAYGSVDQQVKSGYTITHTFVTKMGSMTNPSALSLGIGYSTSLEGKQVWITNSVGTMILGPYTLTSSGTGGNVYVSDIPPETWWANGTVIKLVLCVNGC